MHKFWLSGKAKEWEWNEKKKPTRNNIGYGRESSLVQTWYKRLVADKDKKVGRNSVCPDQVSGW